MARLYAIVGKRKAGTTALFHSLAAPWKPETKDGSWTAFAQDVAAFAASGAETGLVAKADALLEPARLAAMLHRPDIEAACIVIDRDRRERRLSFIAHERKGGSRSLKAALAAFDAEERAYAAGLEALQEHGIAVVRLAYEDIATGRDPTLLGLAFALTERRLNTRQDSLPFFGTIARIAGTGWYARIRTSAPMMALKRLYYGLLAGKVEDNSFIRLAVLGSIEGPVDGQRRLTRLFRDGTGFATATLDFNGHRGAAGPLRIAVQVLRAAWLAMLGRIDIVYLAISRTRFGMLRDLALLLPFHLRGVPVVAHVHGADFAAFFEAPGMAGLKRRHLARLARIVFIHETYRPVSPALAPKSLMVRNPRPAFLDGIVRKAPDGPVTFGFISSFIPGKGVEDFLRLACLPDMPARFLLAGGANAKFEAYGREIATRIAATPAVENLGYLTDPSPFYARTDVLVFPTTYVSEAVPGVVIEAMCAGCAVAMRHSERLASVFAGAPVLWFDGFETLEAAARAVAAQTPESRQALAAQSRAWVEGAFPDQAAWIAALEDAVLEAAR